MRPYLTIIGLLAVAGCASPPGRYDAADAVRVSRVIDGDTFVATIAGWPALIGADIPIRVAGINCDELHSRDAAERARAVAARDRVRELLGEADRVRLANIRRGEFFRLIAEVYCDDVSLGDTLIAEGLAESF